MSTVVLVVDDDHTIRRLVTLLLEDAGYTVLQAADYAEAESELAAAPKPVDLLLADQHLGVESGRETGREFARKHALRLLYMSGAFTETTRTDLPKPFRPADLLHAVRRALGEAPEGARRDEPGR
jgi:DNA-binding response OmpR family regulator